MTETIALDVHLRGYVRRDTPARWLSACPMVGVASQGSTAEEARNCLRSAVELWFESCVERGVLDQALREANFRPAGSVEMGSASGGDETLGEPFELHLSIPAYEAALLGATA
jgi:hypothetical protein